MADKHRAITTQGDPTCLCDGGGSRHQSWCGIHCECCDPQPIRGERPYKPIRRGGGYRDQQYSNFSWKNIFAPHTIFTSKSGKNIFTPHTYLPKKTILAPHTYVTNEKGQNIFTPHTYLVADKRYVVEDSGKVTVTPIEPVAVSETNGTTNGSAIGPINGSYTNTAGVGTQSNTMIYIMGAVVVGGLAWYMLKSKK